MNLVAPGPGPAYPSHERAAAAAELETALYDRETCGKIIGPGGSTIKSIRESTGAKVVVSNESVCGMQVVSLSGSEAERMGGRRERRTAGRDRARLVGKDVAPEGGSE